MTVESPVQQTETICRIEAPICWTCDEDETSYDMRLVAAERVGMCRTLVFQCNGCDDVVVSFLKAGW
jgi:hypothetical protein